MTISTKFNIGQRVFFMDDNTIKNVVITSIVTHSYKGGIHYVEYGFDVPKEWNEGKMYEYLPISERQLYASKEELIRNL